MGGPYVDAITFLVRAHGFGTVLFENSVLAADVAAGLSSRFDAGVNRDLQALVERGGLLVGVRLALNDTLAIDVGWVGDVRLAIFRIGLFEPAEHPLAGQVWTFEPECSHHSLASKAVERIATAAVGQARLATADIIVAGGRGVRDRESLGLLEDLAQALGGAVAVTLPLVDRGWYPHANQVGQTVQKVRPRLYLACGVSGALAHRVGMEKSGVIIAINSDPTAPIFGICDGGVVGDLHEIVPELTRLVRQGRPSRPQA